jgi:NADH-quinone oxidoreductase subunit G/NADP-reducing hydrogenase subunit HndD
VITIEINGHTVKANKNETILQTAKRNGIAIPTLCWMEHFSPTGACRICVVEVDGMRNLIPSCAYPVSEGMKIHTHTPRVIRARKTIVELLLASHPDDCLYCVRSGTCKLQGLAEELGVRQRRYTGEKNTYKPDTSSPAIIRDPAKCILCGKCVRVCEETQGIGAIDFIKRGASTRIGTAFDMGLNVSSCVFCGQCIKVCPTGALRETSHLKHVTDALQDKNMICVVQHAPSISVTIGDEFGIKPGVDSAGKMNSALRRLGFAKVFDTAFAADLTIMEEASELVGRIKNNGPLPILTSCSPGWVKFVEQFYPEFIPNISSCKSPQQMMGAIIKSFYAKNDNIDSAKIFSVSIMPCTAKKFEADRPEMKSDSFPDIDAVLTTRELARLLQLYGIELGQMPDEPADSPFGARSSAGKLFGATGGVAEAAVRTAYQMITGNELPIEELDALRGFDPIKTAHLDVNGTKVGVAVVSGLGNARKILDQIRDGRNDIHIIEVMTCPGGCISGGGQPISSNPETVGKRMQALYKIDRTDSLRVSHKNEEVQRLYKEFLGEPNSHKAHELLHTHYTERNVLI